MSNRAYFDWNANAPLREEARAVHAPLPHDSAERHVTGEARYGDWIERLLYNAIGAALPIVEYGLSRLPACESFPVLAT